MKRMGGHVPEPESHRKYIQQLNRAARPDLDAELAELLEEDGDET